MRSDLEAKMDDSDPLFTDEVNEPAWFRTVIVDVLAPEREHGEPPPANFDEQLRIRAKAAWAISILRREHEIATFEESDCLLSFSVYVSALQARGKIPSLAEVSSALKLPDNFVVPEGGSWRALGCLAKWIGLTFEEALARIRLDYMGKPSYALKQALFVRHGSVPRNTEDEGVRQGSLREALEKVELWLFERDAELKPFDFARTRLQERSVAAAYSDQGADE
jgi:hypothetical protein